MQKEMQSVLAKSRIVRDKLDEPLKSIANSNQIISLGECSETSASCASIQVRP